MLHAMYVYKPKIQNLILKCMRKFFSVCWPWLCKSSMYPNVNFYGKWLYLSVQYVSCWYKFPYKTFICKDFSYLSLVQAPEQLLWIGMLEIKKYGKVSVQSFLRWMLKQMQMLTLSPLSSKVERTKFPQLQKLQYYHISLIPFDLKEPFFKHFTFSLVKTISLSYY